MKHAAWLRLDGGDAERRHRGQDRERGADGAVADAAAVAGVVPIALVRTAVLMRRRADRSTLLPMVHTHGGAHPTATMHRARRARDVAKHHRAQESEEEYDGARGVETT
jgi:hypothetical protein